MKEFTPAPSTGDRWLELRHKARAGNREAEAQLLAELRPFLKKVVERQLQGQVFGSWDASDVVQACSLKILLPGPELNGTTGREFLAWLETVARNEFLDAVRAGAALKRGGGQRLTPLPGDSGCGDMLAAGTSTPSQQLIRQEDRERLEAALGRLSPDHQQVMRLRLALDDWSWAEIARQMNRTEDAVKQLFRRASKQLSRELRNQP
jgi:RNA polymerase sigma factor (sigma-70 family)